MQRARQAAQQHPSQPRRHSQIASTDVDAAVRHRVGERGHARAHQLALDAAEAYRGAGEAALLEAVEAWLRAHP